MKPEQISKQAREILSLGANSESVECKIIHIAKTKSPWSDRAPVNKYMLVMIRHNMRSAEFEFYDSIHNTERNKKPLLSDILSCLLSDMSILDYCANIDDFQREFCPDGKVSQVFKTWQKIQDNTENLKRIITPEKLEKLQELLQDY